MNKTMSLHSTLYHFLTSLLSEHSAKLQLFSSEDAICQLFSDMCTLGCDFFELVSLFSENERLGTSMTSAILAAAKPTNTLNISNKPNLRQLIPHWTGSKYHSGTISETLMDIECKIATAQYGIFMYNSNLNPQNSRTLNDRYILVVSPEENLFIDLNRRKTHRILCNRN